MFPRPTIRYFIQCGITYRRSGTTSGTGELNGAYYSVLGVHQFEVVEVELANLEGLAEAEVVNVDDEAFGDGGVEGFHLEFLHRERELTTGLNTFGVAFELHGYFNNNGLVVVHLKEVDVEDGVLNGVELDVLEDSHALFAVEVELDGEDVGGIDELAHSVVRHNEVGGHETFAVADFNELFAGLEGAGEGKVDDFTAVEHNGDEVLGTEGLGGFFAELGTGLGGEFESLHLFKIMCYSKLRFCFLISHHTGMLKSDCKVTDFRADNQIKPDKKTPVRQCIGVFSGYRSVYLTMIFDTLLPRRTI